MPTHPIKMPQLGLTMNAGRVVLWLVAAGDEVRLSQPLVTIESEKAQQDVLAEIAGVLTEILVKADEEVVAGTVLGMIEGSTA
jgi:pyruvate dehydrogenase E2 component (dihydrolipoamide acetyltransferase)